MVIGILNRRINRLRKRYDKLLRGRGEINMEELVSMHSKEIENSEIKLSELENDFKLQKRFYKKKYRGNPKPKQSSCFKDRIS